METKKKLFSRAHPTADRLEYAAFAYLMRLEQCRRWIKAVISSNKAHPSPESIELLSSASPSEFVKILQNGVILAELASVLAPEAVPKIHHNPLFQIQYTDNIAAFLRACEVLGLRKLFLFSTPDLYDMKNSVKVVSCIHALASHVGRRGLFMSLQDLDREAEATQFSDQELAAAEKDLQKAEAESKGQKKGPESDEHARMLKKVPRLAELLQLQRDDGGYDGPTPSALSPNRLESTSKSDAVSASLLFNPPSVCREIESLSSWFSSPACQSTSRIKVSLSVDESSTVRVQLAENEPIKPQISENIALFSSCFMTAMALRTFRQEYSDVSELSEAADQHATQFLQRSLSKLLGGTAPDSAQSALFFSMADHFMASQSLSQRFILLKQLQNEDGSFKKGKEFARAVLTPRAQLETFFSSVTASFASPKDKDSKAMQTEPSEWLETVQTTLGPTAVALCTMEHEIHMSYLRSIIDVSSGSGAAEDVAMMESEEEVEMRASTMMDGKSMDLSPSDVETIRSICMKAEEYLRQVKQTIESSGEERINVDQVVNKANQFVIGQCSAERAVERVLAFQQLDGKFFSPNSLKASSVSSNLFAQCLDLTASEYKTCSDNVIKLLKSSDTSFKSSGNDPSDLSNMEDIAATFITISVLERRHPSMQKRWTRPTVSAKKAIQTMMGTSYSSQLFTQISSTVRNSFKDAGNRFYLSAVLQNQDSQGLFVDSPRLRKLLVGSQTISDALLEAARIRFNGLVQLQNRAVDVTNPSEEDCTISVFACTVIDQEFKNNTLSSYETMVKAQKAIEICQKTLKEVWSEAIGPSASGSESSSEPMQRMEIEPTAATSASAALHALDQKMDYIARQMLARHFVSRLLNNLMQRQLADGSWPTEDKTLWNLLMLVITTEPPKKLYGTSLDCRLIGTAFIANCIHKWKKRISSYELTTGTDDDFSKCMDKANKFIQQHASSPSLAVETVWSEARALYKSQKKLMLAKVLFSSGQIREPTVGSDATPAAFGFFETSNELASWLRFPRGVFAPVTAEYYLKALQYSRSRIEKRADAGRSSLGSMQVDSGFEFDFDPNVLSGNGGSSEPILTSTRFTATASPKFSSYSPQPSPSPSPMAAAPTPDVQNNAAIRMPTATAWCTAMVLEYCTHASLPISCLSAFRDNIHRAGEHLSAVCDKLPEEVDAPDSESAKDHEARAQAAVQNSTLLDVTSLRSAARYFITERNAWRQLARIESLLQPFTGGVVFCKELLKIIGIPFESFRDSCTCIDWEDTMRDLLLQQQQPPVLKKAGSSAMITRQKSEDLELRMAEQQSRSVLISETIAKTADELMSATSAFEFKTRADHKNAELLPGKKILDLWATSVLCSVTQANFGTMPFMWFDTAFKSMHWIGLQQPIVALQIDQIFASVSASRLPSDIVAQEAEALPRSISGDVAMEAEEEQGLGGATMPKFEESMSSIGTSSPTPSTSIAEKFEFRIVRMSDRLVEQEIFNVKTRLGTYAQVQDGSWHAGRLEAASILQMEYASLRRPPAAVVDPLQGHIDVSVMIAKVWATALLTRMMQSIGTGSIELIQFLSKKMMQGSTPTPGFESASSSPYMMRMGQAAAESSSSVSEEDQKLSAYSISMAQKCAHKGLAFLRSLLHPSASSSSAVNVDDLLKNAEEFLRQKCIKKEKPQPSPVENVASSPGLTLFEVSPRPESAEQVQMMTEEERWIFDYESNPHVLCSDATPEQLLYLIRYYVKQQSAHGSEMIQLHELRESILSTRTGVAELERMRSELDTKIQLLVKNRISLEEAIRGTRNLKKKQQVQQQQQQQHVRSSSFRSAGGGMEGLGAPSRAGLSMDKQSKLVQVIEFLRQNPDALWQVLTSASTDDATSMRDFMDNIIISELFQHALSPFDNYSAIQFISYILTHKANQMAHIQPSASSPVCNNFLQQAWLALDSFLQRPEGLDVTPASFFSTVLEKIVTSSEPGWSTQRVLLSKESIEQDLNMTMPPEELMGSNMDDLVEHQLNKNMGLLHHLMASIIESLFSVPEQLPIDLRFVLTMLYPGAVTSSGREFNWNSVHGHLIAWSLWSYLVRSLEAGIEQLKSQSAGGGPSTATLRSNISLVIQWFCTILPANSAVVLSTANNVQKSSELPEIMVHAFQSAFEEAKQECAAGFPDFLQAVARCTPDKDLYFFDQMATASTASTPEDMMKRELHFSPSALIKLLKTVSDSVSTVERERSSAMEILSEFVPASFVGDEQVAIENIKTQLRVLGSMEDIMTALNTLALSEELSAAAVSSGPSGAEIQPVSTSTSIDLMITEKHAGSMAAVYSELKALLISFLRQAPANGGERAHSLEEAVDQARGFLTSSSSFASIISSSSSAEASVVGGQAGVARSLSMGRKGAKHVYAKSFHILSQPVDVRFSRFQAMMDSLEEQGRINSSDGYKSLLIDLLNDVSPLGRVYAISSIPQLRMTLQSLQQRRTFLESQLDAYHAFLESARLHAQKERSQEKKSKDKTPTFKYASGDLIKRGVLMMPTIEKGQKSSELKPANSFKMQNLGAGNWIFSAKDSKGVAHTHTLQIEELLQLASRRVTNFSVELDKKYTLDSQNTIAFLNKLSGKAK